MKVLLAFGQLLINICFILDYIYTFDTQLNSILYYTVNQETK